MRDGKLYICLEQIHDPPFSFDVTFLITPFAIMMENILHE